MVDLTKLAGVFDAMADYVDYIENEKTATASATRAARLDKVASAHAAVHGEELPVEMRKKLASSDAALDYAEDLLTKQGGAVTPLGYGVTPETDERPKTVKEAADAADAQFLNWITNS